MPIELLPESVISHGRAGLRRSTATRTCSARSCSSLGEVQAVTELAPDEWTDLHEEIHRTCAALDALFEPDQYNHAFLMNVDAQVHLHMVPRYNNPRQWDGKTFDDPHPGELFGTEQRVLDHDELARLAAAIRDRLPAGTSEAT